MRQGGWEEGEQKCSREKAGAHGIEGGGLQVGRELLGSCRRSAEIHGTPLPH